MPWYDYINIGLLVLIWVFIIGQTKQLFYHRKNWLLFFLVYTLTEFVSLPLSLKGINNLWLYNTSRPLQFFFLIAYFISLFHIQKRAKKILYISTVLVCLVFLLFTNLKEYNSIAEMVFNCIILILCILYFYKLIKNDSFVFSSLSEFWFCTSFFVFFGTNLCITGSLNFLLEKQIAIAHRLFYVLVINSIIYYLLVIYAVIVDRGNYLRKING